MVDVNSILEKNSCFPEYNPELQLRIVKRVIDQLMILQDEADQAIRPYENEPSEEFQRDSYEDVFYDSCYTPVIVSQSLIAVVASFLEGLFRHEISWFCTITQGEYPNDTHHRCRLKKNDFWDITVRSTNGNPSEKPNVVIGVWQILKSLQLDNCFEGDFHQLTKLIFEYRNFSMHNGFEWGEEERKRFNKSLSDNHSSKFERYFSWSKSGDNLWMVSINKEFINTLQEFCKGVVNSFDQAHDGLTQNQLPPF